MNALTPIMLASAYRQLSVFERQFVDTVVERLEKDAETRNERVSLALYRPIPDDLTMRAGGMFEKALVRAAIAERVNEIAVASELSVRRIVKEQMSIAFASIGNYIEFDDGGMPVFTLDKCTPEQFAAIKRLEIEQKPRGGQTFKFELHAKQPALDALMKFTGADQPDNPYWRADNAKDINGDDPDAGLSNDDMAEAYARMIAD